MFDHDNPLKSYFDELKNLWKQDILNMIDFALDTRDVAWWNELHEQLERVG